MSRCMLVAQAKPRGSVGRRHLTGLPKVPQPGKCARIAGQSRRSLTPPIWRRCFLTRWNRLAEPDERGSSVSQMSNRRDDLSRRTLVSMGSGVLEAGGAAAGRIVDVGFSRLGASAGAPHDWPSRSVWSHCQACVGAKPASFAVAYVRCVFTS